MRKLLMFGLAWLVVLIAIPAMADVNVLVTVDKDKDIRVIETLTKVKTVTIDVDVVATGAKAAESLALVNQTTVLNTACENCAEKQSIIQGSVNLNTGITNVNQAAGNMNNQGNVLSVAVDFDQGSNGQNGGTHTGFAEAQTSVDQAVIDNEVNSVNLVYRDSLIENSVNENVGITSVNQASGQMNNQANATSLGVCLESGVALSEADLGQFIGSVDALAANHEDNTAKTAQIIASVNANQGVTFVNQTSGNLGNQSNTLSLAVSITQ